MGSAPRGSRRAALGLLLQVLLGWGSAQQPGSCPAPCECSEAARTVKCVNRNLTAVPPDLPPYTRLLFLTGNRLASLPPGALLSLLPALRRISLGHNTWVCDCCIEHLVSWLKESDQVEGKGALKCSYPDKMQDKALVKTNSSDLDCSVPVDIQSQLQTSYVFLGIVLALIGAIFLLVLFHREDSKQNKRTEANARFSLITKILQDCKQIKIKIT
uniref:Uncharacterized protein n=1 Tax=Chelydra serpentina TaxID=8475 RepID=A0A8C3XQV1_CHESE